MDNIIAVDHVTFSYVEGTPVLRDVSLSVSRGAYVALLGANGSGKSTLARHFNGILLPATGTVTVDGIDTRDDAKKMEIKRRVGMVFQHPDNQIVATTVEDDVAFGLENFNMPPDAIAERVALALEQTGLWPYRTRPPHLLSGGQKQRLAIAGALAMDQPVVVLDEATSMLDASGRREVLRLVRQLNNQGTTIIAVTHHMDEVLEADDVIVLHDGSVVMSGSPRAVFQQNQRLRELNLDVPLISQVAGLLHEKVPGVPAEATDVEEVVMAVLESTRPAPHREHSSSDHESPREAPCIVVRELAHEYLRGTPLAHQGLKRADFIIHEGEAVAIVGATGSGKSTVMQHLNGIYRPQAGTVVAVEVDLGQPNANIPKVRREVGMLFQNPEDQLFEQLVGDDVAYGPMQLKLQLKEVRQRVRYGLEMVGLDFEAFMDRPIYALSGGEKRRVALAGVLALKPKVLVLDEPTAGLDPATAQDLFRRLHRLKAEGVAVVFVTHNLEEVLDLADRVVMMQDAETQGTYAVDELIKEPDIIARHGFEVPSILRLQQQLRKHGYAVSGRTPEAVVDSLLNSMDILPARETSGDLR
ncbi:energy-coupling factor transporter ATPase [Sulfobacillus harzensis]|uniref:Energy-coupling factor transporter ATPase n=1 Tax=Sulfobacillus harzensis TaxID=2729629 RepID=A0A7Y0Q4W7_9FIRM|nr:energy-coupling factor transporter ATPase [Sulfobacillus harzensis]NMP23644.1 energy-coupling factor transporter ATPase [Sulfobacillus harzensis]